ncbi:UNVERIFIED_CONTAM: hypothetical protein FKN15_077754 [Acipenser sinensis]
MSECNSSMDHDAEAFNHNSVFLNESVGDPMLEEDLGISGRTELVSLPRVKEQFKGIMQPNLEADPNLEKLNPNLTLVVPCMQECTKNKNTCNVDIGTKKIDLESVTPGNEVAVDADERLPDPPVTKKSPVSSNSPENGSADNTHASLDSLNSNEMVMRSNSFMLSSSEKPPSASILEATNSTSSIPSDQGKFSSTMPDVCGGTFENIQPEISSCNFDAKQCTVEVPKELPEDGLQVDCNAAEGQCLPNYLHSAQLGSFLGAAAVGEVECLSLADHFVKDVNLEISDQEGALLIHAQKVGECAVDPSTQDLIPMSKAEADNLIPQLRLMLSPNEGEAARASDETFLMLSTKLAAALDVSKSRVGQKPSLSKPKSSVGPQTTSADFRLPPPVSKLKLGSLSKDGCTTGILSPPRTKQMPAHGGQHLRVRNAGYRLLTWDPVNKTDIFLQMSTKLAAALDVSKSRVGQKPSLSKPKSSVGPQTTSADFRLPPPVSKLKLGSLSKDGCTTGILSPPRTKQMPAHEDLYGRARAERLCEQKMADGKKIILDSSADGLEAEEPLAKRLKLGEVLKSGDTAAFAEQEIRKIVSESGAAAEQQRPREGVQGQASAAPGGDNGLQDSELQEGLVEEEGEEGEGGGYFVKQ